MAAINFCLFPCLPLLLMSLMRTLGDCCDDDDDDDVYTPGQDTQESNQDMILPLYQVCEMCCIEHPPICFILNIPCLTSSEQIANFFNV